MKIESKYNIGDRVWIVDSDYRHEMVYVYSDTINTICVNGNNEIRLWFNNCDDLPEDEVVAYSDLEKLTERIITLEKSVRVKNNSDSNIGE
mgnify:CR=1 FL=1